MAKIGDRDVVWGEQLKWDMEQFWEPENLNLEQVMGKKKLHLVASNPRYGAI